jgi:ABC-2 type transport system permease protein/lipopolysaccharide transport system permease protein
MALPYMQPQSLLNQPDTLRHNRAITSISRGLKSAWADVIEGAKLWRLWGTLGWNEILQRYRRSTLGPLWLTASMAVMVIALGVVYAELFQQRIDDFIPFLCVGIWFGP